jgi:hypothetical protein
LNILKPRSLRVTSVLLIALCIFFVLLYLAAEKKNAHEEKVMETYRLQPGPLLLLRFRAAIGNCEAAYRVAQHHMFFSMDETSAERYYRLASGAKCSNPNEMAHLISLLEWKSSYDVEVDELVSRIGKLDRKLGDAAAMEVALTRKQRTSQ